MTCGEAPRTSSDSGWRPAWLPPRRSGEQTTLPTTGRRLRILVVDASPTVRETLTQLIDEEPDMTVVGQASDGMAAVQQARGLRPDLITMDAYLPRLDGVDATREIMRSAPAPVVIVTGAATGVGSNVTFQALEAGAMDLLPRPSATRVTTAEQRRAFVDQLRATAAASGFESEPPAPRPSSRAPGAGHSGEPPPSLREARELPRELSLIAVGAAIGGPPSLRVMLSPLEPERAPPVVVMQRLSADFIPGLAEWLDDIVACRVLVAESGTRPERGTIYLAPGAGNLRLLSDGRLHVDEGHDLPAGPPSIDAFFDSLAELRRPDHAGILLTGAGADGAEGLFRMRRAGCLTLVQDEASAVASGMPRAAIERGAAMHRANPVQLGRLLADFRMSTPTLPG